MGSGVPTRWPFFPEQSTQFGVGGRVNKILAPLSPSQSKSSRELGYCLVECFRVIHGGLRDICKEGQANSNSAMATAAPSSSRRRSHDANCMSCRHTRPVQKDAQRVCNWIVKDCSTEELSRPWVVLPGEPPLQITGVHIKQVFGKTYRLDVSLCGAILQSFGELEFDACTVRGEKKPRIYIHPEWAHRVTSGPRADDSILEMFNNPPSATPLDQCKLVIALCYIGGNWSCYAFDFENRLMSIMDPLIGGARDQANVRMHKTYGPTLLEHAIKCMRALTGVSVLGSGFWDRVILTCEGFMCKPWNTGLYVLNYARWFNGTTVCDPIGRLNTVAESKRELIYQMMGMRSNIGSLQAFEHLALTQPVPERDESED